jgi:hypothetical protein
MMTFSRRCLTLLLAVALLLPGTEVLAAKTGTGTESPEQEKRYRWSVSAGGAAVQIDSSYKVTDKESGFSLFIDPEGQLNLSEREYVPSVYLLARLGGRHFISAGYTRFRRTSGEWLLDESLDLDDITLEAGTSLEFQWDSDDFDVSYGYRIHKDDRLRILAKFGVYALDLTVRILADGSYTIDGVTETGRFEEEASLVAPLPLFGLIFDFDITPRWSLATAVEAVYAPVGDITGRALRTRIYTDYRLTRLLDFTFGLSYFKIGVVDENDEVKQEIKYGYDGVYAGLSFNF